jgi:hypothetical protein
MAPAQMYLAGYYTQRGDWGNALVHATRACFLAPLPNAIGLAAGHARRMGDHGQMSELVGKLQPPDAFGVPRGLGVYHWAVGEFDAAADWFEKSIDQRDPWGSIYFWSWYGRDVRSTPRWAVLMRKFNLPESTA